MKTMIANMDLRTKFRWLAVFLLFFGAPQFVFRFAAKVLRPVVDAADDIVTAAESLGGKFDEDSL